MKTLLILIILLPLTIYAQDNEPPAWDFQWGYSETFRPFNPDSMKQTSVLTGFQWGGSTNMNNALHNIVHGGNPGAVDSNFTEDMYMIGQPPIEGIRNMAMIQFEPTLVTSDFRDFKTRYNDPTNAIFRFSNGLSIISNAYSTLSNSLSTNGNAITNDGNGVFKGGMTLRDSGIDSQDYKRTKCFVYVMTNCLIYPYREDDFI